MWGLTRAAAVALCAQAGMLAQAAEPRPIAIVHGTLGDGRGGAAEPLDALTPRQREILQLAAEGHSSKEIAQRLGLSPRTVEAHRAQLMERLDLHDVAGLVRFAVKVGLVTPEG